MERGKSYYTVRRIAEKALPPLTIVSLHRDRLTGKEHLDSGPTFQKKKYKDRAKFELLYEIYDIKIEHFVDLHNRLHNISGLKCSTESICFSGDGVPESKQRSVDIYSIRFDGCRQVYNVKVVKKYSKEVTLSCAEVLDPLIKQFNNLKIRVSST
jgi:hypothetical protein